jgi:hypothetical protein
VAIYCLFAKRKKEQQRLEDDEKVNGPFSDAAAIHAPRPVIKAPRLSLRPVTQFLPNLYNSQGAQAAAAAGAGAGAGAAAAHYPDRRASRGSTIQMTATPTSPTGRAVGASAWERRPSAASPTNPFGDAQRIAEEPSAGAAPVSPVSMGGASQAMSTVSSLDKPLPAALAIGAAGVAAGAVAGAGAAGVLTRKTSIRKDNAPKALDLTKPMHSFEAVPASPAGTEYSVDYVAPGQSPGPSAGAAAIAAAGGPPQSTVHRVQLDFHPTLEDEMGLTAGQLVRLLHEYDDGWVSSEEATRSNASSGHFFFCMEWLLTQCRHSASASTALSRALFLALACPHAPSSLGRPRVALVVLR